MGKRLLLEQAVHVHVIVLDILIIIVQMDLCIVNYVSKILELPFLFKVAIGVSFPDLGHLRMKVCSFCI